MVPFKKIQKAGNIDSPKQVEVLKGKKLKDNNEFLKTKFTFPPRKKYV